MRPPRRWKGILLGTVLVAAFACELAAFGVQQPYAIALQELGIFLFGGGIGGMVGFGVFVLQQARRPLTNPTTDYGQPPPAGRRP